MKYFITGIGTDVGKTIVSAIFTEALQADYWKPIQAGDLHNSDANKIKNLTTNSKTIIHNNSYALKTPASPHYAAELDNVTINLSNIIEPKTNNHLIIEGAGGIFVPINNSQTILDIIKPNYKVIIVSKHYLGSINHTLLTIDALKNRNIKVAGIVFNGNENKATESVIKDLGKIKIIGRIDTEPFFDKTVINYYAEKMLPEIKKI